MKDETSELRHETTKIGDRAKTNSRASIMALGKNSNRRVTFHFFSSLIRAPATAAAFLHTFSLSHPHLPGFAFFLFVTFVGGIWSFQIVEMLSAAKSFVGVEFFYCFA